MFGHRTTGDRGDVRAVIPKARRGIHDTNPNMSNISRLIKSTEKHNENFEGEDEVDNIISKFRRSSSPIIITQKRLPRRSSVDAELSDESGDSDTEDILSKSSPAVFEIHSYYRDENHQHINKSRDISHSLSQENVSRNSESLFRETQYKTKDGINLKLLVPIIIALCAICYVAYSNYSIIKDSSINYDRINFYDDVRSMAQKYKIKRDSMLQVRTGIDTIFQKEDAGSFIFTYDGNLFDSLQFYTFMDNISSSASRYLRNYTKDVQHIVLDTSKVITFKSDTDLIQEFSSDLYKSGVLLVKNIERIPAKLAMAFHYYCDEFNPLVKKSAIFFTLDITKCNLPLLSKASIDHDYIERCLKDKWGEVDKDKIMPLLTRVVGVIVDVTNI